ncbi:hypothetical protein RJG79_06225 [Mycoplasmatota bacterium WC44]
MTLKNELENLGIKVESIKKINNDLYDLSDGYNNYILKLAEDNGVYEFLFAQGVKQVLYPLSVNGKNSVTIKNRKYYLFNYMNEIEYQPKKKIYDLADSLKEVHFSTMVQKKIKPQKVILRFKKMYEFLGEQFNKIDAFMRSYESKDYLTDTDFMILNRYHVLLDIKYYMGKMQYKILDHMEKELEVYLCLNHGNPDISHLINKRLISFNKSKFTIPVYDIALFYINSANLNINHKKLIMDWLDKFDDKFYVYYFRFLVLYVYVFGINLSSFEVEHNILATCNKIEDFIKMFLTPAENKNENQQYQNQ